MSFLDSLDHTVSTSSVSKGLRADRLEGLIDELYALSKDLRQMWKTQQVKDKTNGNTLNHNGNGNAGNGITTGLSSTTTQTIISENETQKDEREQVVGGGGEEGGGAKEVSDENIKYDEAYQRHVELRNRPATYTIMSTPPLPEENIGTTTNHTSVSPKSLIGREQRDVVNEDIDENHSISIEWEPWETTKNLHMGGMMGDSYEIEEDPFEQYEGEVCSRPIGSTHVSNSYSRERVMWSRRYGDSK